MKRFWTKAAVATEAGHHSITLDGRPMRLPGGPLLRLRQRALAEAIAAEWQAAPGTMTAEHVPLTRLAGTAQERVAPDPAVTIDGITAYAATDLLCYRAERPDTLVQRQHDTWQPWLDWAAETYGARLAVTAGIMPITQDHAALARLRAAAAAHDAFTLAGLGVIVPILGSLVLGLALAANRLTAGEAYRASILDELFEEELWGIDDDAITRRANAARDVADAARFMALCAAG